MKMNDINWSCRAKTIPNVPVPILEFWIWMWLESPISMPSVLGLSSGALIVMLLMFTPLQPVIEIWAFWGLVCVNPLISRSVIENNCSACPKTCRILLLSIVYIELWFLYNIFYPRKYDWKIMKTSSTYGYSLSLWPWTCPLTIYSSTSSQSKPSQIREVEPIIVRVQGLISVCNNLSCYLWRNSWKKRRPISINYLLNSGFEFYHAENYQNAYHTSLIWIKHCLVLYSFNKLITWILIRVGTHGPQNLAGFTKNVFAGIFMVASGDWALHVSFHAFRNACTYMEHKWYLFYLFILYGEVSHIIQTKRAQSGVSICLQILHK